ncbi:MAG TPA: B12-binding domain-containing radical SAM protein [Candidatus Hydrogenedentes bacterium]|nr:B12-binding domain-containing radical SAM protein [Candidatus Hydrogenedentota bacterium]
MPQKPLRIFLLNVGLRRPLYPLATPPMGLLYLAAYLREHFDVDVRILNQRVDNDSPESITKQVVEFGADVVGWSCFTTFAYLLGELSESVRKALPDALQLLGGPHASALGENALVGNVIDAAVPGEGELAFEAILNARLDHGDLSGVPGLIRREADGSVVTNPGDVPLIEELDSLPMPAYDLIDMAAYWKRQSIAPVFRRRYVSLVSSRGCPYGCIWCHKIFGKRIRLHSAERIVEEVDYFKRQYGVDDFEFLDDNVNFKAERMVAFTEALHERNLKLQLAFPTAVRGDLMTDEVVDALADAGMYLCGYSLETGSTRLQKFTGKHLDIPKFLDAVARTARRHVYITGFCMMGFPTETEKELQRTIDVACASKFHTASFFTVTPFPGTPLYDMVQRTHPEKLEHLDYNRMDFSAMKVNLTDLPNEVLYRYQRLAMRKFFLNPRRIASLLRAYPKPLQLPVYAPFFLHRATKGLFERRRSSDAQTCPDSCSGA